jgi:hypothetical protein
VFGEAPITHVGGPIWNVPSETTSKTYTVNIERLTCECPYWRKMHEVCKHIEALRIFRSRSQYGPSERFRLPNKHKNPPWTDRLHERQFEILCRLLRCLGREATRAGAGESVASEVAA